MPSDSSPRFCRIAALQPDLRPQAPAANMVLLRQMVENLVAAAAIDLVILPEIFDGQTDPRPGVDPAADATAFLCHLARACRVNVIGGTVVSVRDSGPPRNTSLVVSKTGELVGQYDKRVLFSHEADHRVPGDGPGVFDLDGVRVGVLICADLWHPELARETLGSVDVLCVPAKTSVPSDRYVKYARFVWLNLALTRAMENGVAVAVSDWTAARHEEASIIDGAKTRRTYHTSGAATICDPGRRPEVDSMQRAIDPKQRGAVCHEVDLTALDEFRKYRRAVGLIPG